MSFSYFHNPIQPYSAFSCYFSLVFCSMWVSQPFLVFLTLTVLRTGQEFCNTSLHFGLSDLFSPLLLGHGVWGGRLHVITLHQGYMIYPDDAVNILQSKTTKNADAAERVRFIIPAWRDHTRGRGCLSRGRGKQPVMDFGWMVWGWG